MSMDPVRTAPLFRVALLVMLGVLLGNAIGPSPAVTVGTIAFCAMAFLVLVVVKRCVAQAPVFLPAATLALLAGFAKSSLDRNDSALPPDLLAGQAVAVGRIADPPTTVGTRTRFVMKVEAIRRGGRTVACTEDAVVMLIRTRRDSLPLLLEYGMRVAILGEVRRPSAERNPGEFSPRAYFEANGITLSVFARGHRTVVLLDSSGGWWLMRWVIVPARRSVLSGIDRLVGGEEGEFLKGLLIGERSGIPPATRTAFVNAGVAHVLAVSGSNVAVVAAFLLFVCGLVRLPAWCATAAMAGGLLCYMLMTGSQPPVVRATIMAYVVLAGKLLQRPINGFNGLGLAALIVLAIDSRQLFDIGFQLSFGAVLSIMALYPQFNRGITMLPHEGRISRAGIRLLRLCAVSLTATLGTLPLTAASFGRVSLIGILANILVIPATGCSVVLGALSALLDLFGDGLAEPYAAVNTFLLRWTLSATSIAGGLPLAYIDTLRFRTADALPYYIVLTSMLSFSRPARLRRLVPLALVALIIVGLLPDSSADRRSAGRLRVTFIDVGEGDAMLVECPAGEILLVDAGPGPDPFDAGERTILPLLKRRDIPAIDLFVLTHPHADHLGGALVLLHRSMIRRVADNGVSDRSLLVEDYKNAAAATPLRTVHAGDTLVFARGVRLFVLSPPAGGIEGESTNPNSSSVVMKLVFGAVSFLLVGDADRSAEERMLGSYGDLLRSTVLKVGHHGSSTSTSEGFVESVRPELAVVSVGAHNKFRHPSLAVIERLERSGARVCRTDEEGAIILETDGTMLETIPWR
jgi:competence protein ComEC